MENININPVLLGEIELYQNGERANSDNLNRPIVQLRDNQTSQNTMLNEIYSVLGGDVSDLDTLQEVIDKVTSIEAVLLSDDSSLDTIQELINMLKSQGLDIQALEDAGTTNSAGETSEFLGSISVAETLTVSGITTLEDDLSVAGILSAPDGILNLGDGLDVPGNVTIGGVIATPDNKLDILGSLEITDELIVGGTLKSALGEEYATQSWVLINGGGGTAEGGAVEITNNFDFIGDGSTDTFAFSFIKDSVGVFIEGLLQNSDTYTLNYDDDEDGIINEIGADNAVGDTTEGIRGVSITFNTPPTNLYAITLVAYGGADVYTKDQIDLFVVSELASVNQLDKKIEREDILSMVYLGGASGDKLSKINYTSSYSQIFSYNNIDKMQYIDHQINNINEAYSTMIYGSTDRLESVTFTNSAR